MWAPYHLEPRPRRRQTGGIALHELLQEAVFAADEPPNGGNCTTRGFDTPATRRKRASCSAKPPSPPT